MEDPAGQLSCQTRRFVFTETGNPLLGRQKLCAVVRIFLPAKVQIHKPRDLDRTTAGIVRRPFLSLACVTCTKEGIYEWVALAQIAVVWTGWPPVGVSLGQGVKFEPCQQDESTRLVDARQKTTHSPRCIPTTGTLQSSMDFGRESCTSEQQCQQYQITAQGYVVTTACIPNSTSGQYKLEQRSRRRRARQPQGRRKRARMQEERRRTFGAATTLGRVELDESGHSAEQC